jgi:hypothetical protein
LATQEDRVQGGGLKNIYYSVKTATTICRLASANFGVFAKIIWAPCVPILENQKSPPFSLKLRNPVFSLVNSSTKKSQGAVIIACRTYPAARDNDYLDPEAISMNMT